MKAKAVIAECVFLKSVLFFLLVGIVAIPSLKSGITGQISGKVMDVNEQPIADVHVKMFRGSNIEPERTIMTSKKGIFRFPQLSPGDYSFVFEKEQYKTETRKNIQISVNANVQLDVILTNNDDQMK